MQRTPDNRVETQGTNAATKASNTWLQRAGWNLRERFVDGVRIATLPLRLAGTIVSKTFHEVDDLDSISQMGFVMYEGLVATTGAALLVVGISLLASNPVGWALAAGIGLTAAGGVAELPNVLIPATGIVKGIGATIENEREQWRTNREIRAERRQNWH